MIDLLSLEAVLQPSAVVQVLAPSGGYPIDLDGAADMSYGGMHGPGSSSYCDENGEDEFI
jgi:hypothetical protein